MSSAANLYHSVINDVITSVRDSFLDESVDENVLQELKQIWMTKLDASKTIEPAARSQEALLDSKMATGRSAAAMASSMAGTSGSGGGGASSQQRKYVAPRSSASSSSLATGSSTSSQQQIVITDPNRLVPVQITIPAQPGNPSSQARMLTVQVPAHALQQQGPSSVLLQQVLTNAITQALILPESHAAVFLQQNINQTFKL